MKSHHGPRDRACVEGPMFIEQYAELRRVPDAVAKRIRHSISAVTAVEVQ